MAEDLKQALEIIQKHSEELEKDYAVKRIGVFGSTAKGKSTKKSDVDILVEFSKPVDFFVFIDLQNFLTEILGREVDLVTKNALKPLIKKKILEEVTYA